MEIDETRVCTKCGIEKALEEFNKTSKPDNSRKRACRVCTSAASGEWQRKNAERAKANLARWRAANPEKRQAQVERHREAIGSLGLAILAWRARQRRAENPEKFREINRRSRAAHRDSSIARTRAWRERNPSLVRKWTQEYRAANRARLREGLAAWYAKNPDAARRHGANRRARKLAVGGKLSTGLAARLFVLQRGGCACGCKEKLDGDYHLDHRVPLALGGANTDSNMQLLRKVCNLKKHAKDPIVFMQERGFLL